MRGEDIAYKNDYNNQSFQRVNVHIKFNIIDFILLVILSMNKTYFSNHIPQSNTKSKHQTINI
jgi:hypothetical protein